MISEDSSCGSSAEGAGMGGKDSRATADKSHGDSQFRVLSSAVHGPPMWASAHVSRPPKSPTKMGFDEVSSLSLQDWGQEVGPPFPPPPPPPLPLLTATSPASSRSLSSAWPAGPTGVSACCARSGKWRSLGGWWTLWMAGEAPWGWGLGSGAALWPSGAPWCGRSR